MDSGLGSDEDRRGRTKEQKQLRNQQLLSGCFIDASSLSDDTEVSEQRRNDERRQGALIFQSSIPQFSMLQMSGSESSCGVNSDAAGDPDTPYNSIVQLDNDTEVARKSPLGFYVDLSEVEEPRSCSPPTTSKKNIFSMVIDFEAPKKGKPVKLSSSTLNLRKGKNGNKSNDSSNGCLSLSASATHIESDPCSSKNNQLNIQSSASTSKVPDCIHLESVSSDFVTTNGNFIDDTCENGCSGAPLCDSNLSTREMTKRNNQNARVDFINPVSTKDLKQVDSPKESDGNEQQFVKLSDLEWQKPRADINITPRMSRSIPESSWVESPLLMSRSAGYRSAPKPLEPEPDSLSDSFASTASQPKRSFKRLGTDLLRMFLEEIGPDVTIDVDGRKIRAHKCILASRCQYFAALLSGNWLEASGNVISLHGFSYEAIYFALCHVYSGAAHVPDSISLVELASLADMLGLEGLKEVVEHALKHRHCHSFHRPCPGCITGVPEVLPLAAAYGLDELYQKCLNWITQHFVKLWPTRGFATLPRELRDKCYQQHVVHMTPDRVLGTSVDCDRILNVLPVARWTEPVGQLVAQLSDACHLYLRQHFAAVLQAPSFLRLDVGLCWEGLPCEERLLAAVKNLSIEQGCRSYARVSRLLEKSWSRPFADLLNRLKVLIEQGLVSQSDRLIRSNAWLRMDTQFRTRIKELTPTNEPLSRLPRATPKRVKPVQTSVSMSSSDSSRNSSPGVNQSQSSHSPSLRRSLLLAARAPQVPPSPSTVRRTIPPVQASPTINRRISTLTQPTASSAAKSAPSKNIKGSNLISRTNVNTRSTTGPLKATTAYTQKKQAPTSSTTSSTAAKKENLISSSKKDFSKRPSSRSSSPFKTDSRSNSPRKLDAFIHSPTKDRRQVNSKRNTPSTEKTPTIEKPSAEPVIPAVMTRSSTFLKEEPTILNKIK